MQCMYVGCDNT